MKDKDRGWYEAQIQKLTLVIQEGDHGEIECWRNMLGKLGSDFAKLKKIHRRELILVLLTGLGLGVGLGWILSWVLS